MAENSKIEWTHHTFNPWRGCTKVSAGCDNCYAETMSGRNPKTLGVWGKYGTRVVASESMWKQPLKWNKAAELAGERHRVFCASLADVFEDNATLPDFSYNPIFQARKRLFKLIEDTPNLDWLLLTKRPQNIEPVLKSVYPSLQGLGINGANKFIKAWLDRVWLGVSVEDQKTADERIPHLLKINARVRFLSMEPLLGPVTLPECTHDVRCPITAEGHSELPLCGIGWVIVGCESGAFRRPMELPWVYEIIDQCKAAGVPVFVKQLQLGGKVEKDIERFPLGMQTRGFPKC